MIQQQLNQDEITIVGRAVYKDAWSCSAEAQIGVLDGQFFIFLFAVDRAMASIMQKPVAHLDATEKFAIHEHIYDLHASHVAEPMVNILSEAHNVEEDGWEISYGYLGDINPPKRYFMLRPPKGEIQPFEYVTRMLTQAREDGPILLLEFFPYGEPGTEG